MISLTVGFREARVWSEDVPELAYDGTVVRECSLPVGPNAAERRRVIVELLVPMGARYLHGALGAVFEPRTAGGLDVRVLASTDPGPVVPWSLAAELEDVHAGLPVEYAVPVIRSAQATPELPVIGSGILTFDRAAHGAVGSSASVFEWLSTAVIRLLAARQLPNSDEALQNLIQLERCF